MKRNLIEKRKAVICIVIAATCLVGIPSLETKAAETGSEEIEVMETTVGELPDGYFDELMNARAVLSGCKTTIGFSSSGMGITIYTGTSSKCPVVGVKDIKVEQKVWYGWKTVAVSTGGECTDTSGMSVYVTFTGAVKGETYRVSCVHYADLTYDGVENITEGESCTDPFVFTY